MTCFFESTLTYCFALPYQCIAFVFGITENLYDSFTVPDRFSTIFELTTRTGRWYTKLIQICGNTL